MKLRPVFIFFYLTLTIALFQCDDSEIPNDNKQPLQLAGVKVGTSNLSLSPSTTTENVPADQSISITFSSPVAMESAQSSFSLQDETDAVVSTTISLQDENKTILLTPSESLKSNLLYTLIISEQLRGASGEKFPGVEITFKTQAVSLQLLSWSVEGNQITQAGRILDVSLTPSFQFDFAKPIDASTATAQNIHLAGPNAPAPIIALSNENKSIQVTFSSELKDLSAYQIIIEPELKGEGNEVFPRFVRTFYTTSVSEPKLPVIADEELLTLVQQQTFKYFYDFAHPASGMARERNTSGNLVTSGGSGFGIMALIVGMERDFITRQQGLDQLTKILTFLETADRFHGAWSHWIDGNTGKVIPFSANDNGGDLVETSLLVQGLITMRQYLDENNATELTLIERINDLWEAVEWDWYTKGGEKVLYWHWSPDKEWTMNLQIRGYNEALITYVLAASSPTYAIEADVYHQGWANNGSITNGKQFYDITLPLGFDFGGPLFFSHYSFLGLDPRNLNDTYGNYWTQNVNHSLINYAYSVDNPKNYAGYGEESWGLTASDNHKGYSAHSPTNDLGVITPTAALSSFPYTPEESMRALKFFYYKLGDRLWGQYGFYDAYNITEGWMANSYLAIDQGPIVVMIENHRTGLLWDLFMSAPEVQAGLNKLSFTY